MLWLRLKHCRPRNSVADQRVYTTAMQMIVDIVRAAVGDNARPAYCGLVGSEPYRALKRYLDVLSRLDRLIGMYAVAPANSTDHNRAAFMT
jgi:hypothetical protein